MRLTGGFYLKQFKMDLDSHRNRKVKQLRITDLQYVLNKDWLKNKLSLDDRAWLLCELCSELRDDSYELTELKSDDGVTRVIEVIGYDIEKAKKDLQLTDKHGRWRLDV